MTIRRVTSPKVPEPPPERWSNCLVCDGIAYVSGMTATSLGKEALAKLDEYEQTKVILDKEAGTVALENATATPAILQHVKRQPDRDDRPTSAPSPPTRR